MRQIRKGQRQAVADRLPLLGARKYRQRVGRYAVGVRVGVWFCIQS